ncbi:hypothetical protein HPB47_013390 [Ixodes persulcatus]|uniref:Uncharacterized protein n=1 Tax=Ixodes persulcatus TaxID=34615 RepID=A0AC60QYL4_IXOPE|nr:hypothetical protein HPB47_013390 [Ixodes persulcatus]
MRVTYNSTTTVKTGRKRVTIERKEWDTVPNYLRIGGHWASFDYSDIKWVCRRCPLEGHIQVNCTTEHCDQCAVFGHATDGFTSECRRCGGSHATVNCVGRRSYSSIVAGAASADFPALSFAHEVTPPRPAPRLERSQPQPSPKPTSTRRTPSPNCQKDEGPRLRCRTSLVRRSARRNPSHRLSAADPYTSSTASALSLRRRSRLIHVVRGTTSTV